MIDTSYNAQFKKVRSQVSNDWIPLDVVPDSSDIWPVTAKALIVQDKARIYETTNLVDFIVAKSKGNMKSKKGDVPNAAIALANDKQVKVFSKTGDLMFEKRLGEEVRAISSGPDPERILLIALTETSLVQMPLTPEYVLSDLTYSLNEEKLNKTVLPAGNYKHLINSVIKGHLRFFTTDGKDLVQITPTMDG